MHIDKIASTAIFIQILNILDLQFQGKNFELNTLASAYVKSKVCRHGGDDADRLPIATMSGAGVFGCVEGLLSEMKCVAVLPIAFSGVCL